MTSTQFDTQRARSSAGDRSALTLATEGEVGLESIPPSRLDLVAAREEEPGEEPREVLDATVELSDRDGGVEYSR